MPSDEASPNQDNTGEEGAGGEPPNGSPNLLHSEHIDGMPPSPIFGSPFALQGGGEVPPNPVAPPLDAEATEEGPLEAPGDAGVPPGVDDLEIMEDIPKDDTSEGDVGLPDETGMDDELEVIEEEVNTTNDDDEEEEEGGPGVPILNWSELEAGMVIYVFVFGIGWRKASVVSARETRTGPVLSFEGVDDNGKKFRGSEKLLANIRKE